MGEQELVDVVVVGAGPAGLSAAGHGVDEGLSCVVLERSDHLADTIHCYQKGKHVMAEPSAVPLRSPLAFEAGTREEVLGTWQRFAEEKSLPVRFRQEVTGVSKDEDSEDGPFTVETASGERFRSRTVILALGTQGNPRKLGVPGQDLPHVTDRLVDPDEHRDRDVVVVGAGDSALEVALALTEHNRVSLVVRKPEIVRAKEALERDALSQNATGQLTIHFSTNVSSIEEGTIVLDTPEGPVRTPADLVIAKIGATPPRRLLEAMGVTFSGDGRDARAEVSASYETAVPGLYLIGAATGRDLIKLGINQGYEVVEQILGRDVLPADEEILASRLPWWDGPVAGRIRELCDASKLFCGAPEAAAREMFLTAEPREAAAGDVLIRQNDYEDSVFLVIDGEIDITAVPDGKQEVRHLASLGAGDFFGEMNLISGRRRAATATAKTAAKLLEIPRKAILKLLAGAPDIKERMDRIFMIRAFHKYLLPGVPEAVLWEMVDHAEQVELGRDQVVFEEGDVGDSFYLIRSGQVKVSKSAAGSAGTRSAGDSKEIVLSYLPAGNFFGETALVSGALRTATVTTIFPTTLIRLGRDDFYRFLEAHPQLLERVERTLEERRVANLVAEATPGSGNVLSELIREEVVMGTDALIIDNHRCVRCNNCIEACEGVHDDGQARLSLTGIQFYNLLAPNSCWQCEDPLCMLDCPPDAIVRDPSGEVWIKDSCIGCGNCEANCPYGNIFMVHPQKPRSLGSRVASFFGLSKQEPELEEATVAVKCDLCRDLGNDPACVRSCPTGAAIRLGPEEYQRTLEELVVRRGEI